MVVEASVEHDLPTSKPLALHAPSKRLKEEKLVQLPWIWETFEKLV